MQNGFRNGKPIEVSKTKAGKRLGGINIEAKNRDKINYYSIYDIYIYPPLFHLFFRLPETLILRGTRLLFSLFQTSSISHLSSRTYP